MTTASHFTCPHQHSFPQFSSALYSTSNSATLQAFQEYHNQLELDPRSIHPHHLQQIHHIQQLQQQAIAKRDQAMYYQYVLAHEQQHQKQLFQLAAERHSPVSPTKSYRVQTRAEKRAEHNAVERNRRDILNNKLQELANSLPNLHSERRPSKGTIIEKTIDYVKKAMEKEKDYNQWIEELTQENKELEEHLLANGIHSTESRHNSLTDLSSCPSLAESPSPVSPAPILATSPSSLINDDISKFFPSADGDMLDCSAPMDMDDFFFGSPADNGDCNVFNYNTSPISQNEDVLSVHDYLTVKADATLMAEEQAHL